MGTAHSKTQRAKSNANEIVIDASFWELRPVEDSFSESELRAKGYKSTLDVMKFAGIAERTVNNWAIRNGLSVAKFRTRAPSGRFQMMNWFYKPKS